jgi:multidrug resistance efflux pump
LQEELTDLRDRVTRAEAERNKAIEVAEAKVAAAERLVTELQAMLAAARQPWWRRWRG